MTAQRPAACAGVTRVRCDLLAPLRQRRGAAEVVRLELVRREAVDEEPARERRPAEQADPVAAHHLEHVRVPRPLEQAERLLARRHRRDGMRALDQLAGVVREPSPADLPLLPEPLQLAPRLLDRRRAVEVVDLEQVDVVDAEAQQAGLEVGADRLRPVVHPRDALGVRHRPALREHEHVVAPALECAAHDLLGSAPAVERCRVDPVRARVESRPDRFDRLALVLAAPVDPLPAGADRRRADADHCDLRSFRAEPSSLHGSDATGRLRPGEHGADGPEAAAGRGLRPREGRRDRRLGSTDDDAAAGSRRPLGGVRHALRNRARALHGGRDRPVARRARAARSRARLRLRRRESRSRHSPRLGEGAPRSSRARGRLGARGRQCPRRVARGTGGERLLDLPVRRCSASTTWRSAGRS